MNRIATFFLVMIAGCTQAPNTSLDGLIESYEEARSKQQLVEWRKKYAHPLVKRPDTELQHTWKKIEDCFSEKNKENRIARDKKRPKAEEIIIREAKVYTFDDMFTYPVKPQKDVRMIYPKGSFQKGAGFHASEHEGKWYRVGPIYTDKYIEKTLKDKEHYIFLSNPECFDQYA